MDLSLHTRTQTPHLIVSRVTFYFKERPSVILAIGFGLLVRLLLELAGLPNFHLHGTCLADNHMGINQWHIIVR